MLDFYETVKACQEEATKQGLTYSNEFEVTHETDRLEIETYLMEAAISTLSNLQVAFDDAQKSPEDNYLRYKLELGKDNYIYWQRVIYTYRTLKG